VLVDPSRVGYEDRLRLLEHMVKRLGASKAAEALGVAKMTVYRMLKGEAPKDDSRLEKVLSAMPAEEVLEILGARKRLEACGAIEGGRVVRGVVLEILRLASEDPVLRELNSFSGFMELVLSLDKGELRARFDVSGVNPAAWVNGYPEVYSGRKPWDTEYVNGFGVPFPMRVGSMSSFLCPSIYVCSG